MAMRQDASTGQMVDDGTPADAEQASGSKELSMQIKVYAAFKVYYDGPGYSISGENDTGPFDILPHHHNFICTLVPCNLVLKTPSGQKTIKISRAIMHVKAEQVTVFIDV